MSNPLTVTAPEGLPFVDFERVIDAPVAEVFRAHADPELVKQWMGPAIYGTDIERWDFVTGGAWRYVSRGPNGEEFPFHGSFHTVRENELAIQTFEFEPVPDTASIETLRFEDLGDGRTRLVGHAVYPSLEARDGMVNSGMEGGMSEGYTRLEDLLAAA